MQSLRPFLLFFLIAFLSCHNGSRNSSELKGDVGQRRGLNSQDSCSLHGIDFLKLAEDFEPSEIDLSKSLGTKISDAVNSIEAECMVREDAFKQFVVIILLKQYLFHLNCCQQSYNLLDMKTGAAKKIINVFQTISFNNQNPEFLRSSIVVDFATRDTVFSKLKEVQEVLQKIDRQ